MVAGLGLIIPPFASGPPDSFQPANHEARVALVSGLGSGTIVMLRLGFGLEVIASLPLAVAMLGLAAGLNRPQSQQVALVGSLATIAVVLFVVEHIPRFVLLQLATEYAGAGEAERTAIGAGNAVAESISAIGAFGFSLFAGASLVAFGRTIRHSVLPRWLGSAALAVGVVSLLAGLVGLASYELGFATFPALLLIVVWFIVAGGVLLRASSSGVLDAPSCLRS